MDGEENRDLLIQSYKTQSDNVFEGNIDKQAWKLNLEGLEGKQMAMNQMSMADLDADVSVRNLKFQTHERLPGVEGLPHKRGGTNLILR